MPTSTIGSGSINQLTTAEDGSLVLERVARIVNSGNIKHERNQPTPHILPGIESIHGCPVFFFMPGCNFKIYTGQGRGQVEQGTQTNSLEIAPFRGGSIQAGNDVAVAQRPQEPSPPPMGVNPESWRREFPGNDNDPAHLST